MMQPKKTLAERYSVLTPALAAQAVLDGDGRTLRRRRRQAAGVRERGRRLGLLRRWGAKPDFGDAFKPGNQFLKGVAIFAITGRRSAE
jgi:hypothetical protein